MPQELDEVDDPDELVEGDLDELADDDDLIEDEEDALEEDEDVAIDDGNAAEEEAEDLAPETPAKPPAGEESEEEEEEEPEDEDVEASLDMILKERLVVEEPEVDEDTPEPDDRSDGVERVLPKQPDEFVCRSCFLVKHPSQLADSKKMLCRDCV